VKRATVSFTRMADGTEQDYALLRRSEQELAAGLADRLLAAFEQERESTEGYQVTRYEHALQAATRAARAGESEEYVVAALFHDLGDMLAPENHSELAAAILAPYVSDEVAWIVRHHGVFQKYYYAHHQGEDRHLRDRYLGHPYYEACARFCEEYDQCSFDPAYDSEPITFFEPMVRRVFSPGHLRPDHHGAAATAAAAATPAELQDAGSISRAGVQRRCFFFAGLGITLQHWQERSAEGDETGVRVEIQRLAVDDGPMEFAARELRLHDPVWRADLFALSTDPAGTFSRAHYHPGFAGREPSDRHWDPDLSRDPVSWLARQLGQLDQLLAAAGRPELAGTADSGRVAAAAPEIARAVTQMLTACSSAWITMA
jgi:predicted HD phosphohydrolase